MVFNVHYCSYTSLKNTNPNPNPNPNSNPNPKRYTIILTQILVISAYTICNVIR